MSDSVVVAKIGTSSITDDHGDIVRAAVEKFCSDVAAVRAVVDLVHDA